MTCQRSGLTLNSQVFRSPSIHLHLRSPALSLLSRNKAALASNLLPLDWPTCSILVAQFKKSCLLILKKLRLVLRWREFLILLKFMSNQVLVEWGRGWFWVDGCMESILHLIASWNLKDTLNVPCKDPSINKFYINARLTIFQSKINHSLYVGLMRYQEPCQWFILIT